jgi:hypothetical protein
MQRRIETATAVTSLLALVMGATPAVAAEPGVLVIELDGGQVSAGPDDAAGRTTPITELVGAFAPYGSDPERREALLQAVRADWATYDVAIASAPPATGDYAMVMVGPSNPFGPQVTGIATLDCDDALSTRSLAFAFYAADDGVPATVAATTISQEAAHGLGLEHVDGPGDIMLPVQAVGDASFTDECLPLSGTAECPDQHAAECGSGALQNAHAELLRRFGPREPDVASPSATITFPADGVELRSDELLTVTVDAEDDQGLAEATLYVDGVGSSTDPDVPYGWEIAELPPGDYEIYVAVADLGGNVGMSEAIEIHVLPGGDASPDDDGGDEPSSGTVPAPPPPLPSPPTTSACAVGRGTAGEPWLGGLLLLLVLGAARGPSRSQPRRPPRRPGRSS